MVGALYVLMGYGLVSRHIYCPPDSLGNKNTTARFQVSSAVQIRYSLFWVVTQRVLVVV
jgi:hypothetical protein